MSYYHKPRPNSLVNRRLFDFVDSTKTPDKSILVIYDSNRERSSLTFKQLSEQSRQLAKGFLKSGLGQGDKILICAPNSFEYAVSWLAAMRIGACAVLACPEDLTEKRVNVLKHFVKCEGIFGVLSLCPEQKAHVLSVFTNLVEMTDSTVKSIVLSGADNTTGIPHENIVIYEDVMTKEYHDQDLEYAESKVQCEDLCFAILTTGTTGPSKAVGFTHHAIVNAINLDVPGGFEQDSVSFSGWPMSWGSEAPCFLAALVIGFTFVTAPFHKITPDDSYDFMLKITEEEKCDNLCIPQQDVPTMIGQKFQEKYDLSSVEGLGYGGQIVPRKTMRALLEIFPEKYVVLVYASVEVMTIALQPLSMANINSDDYGKMFIFPDTEVKVVDQDGLVVPYGDKGLIHIRGPKVFSHYIGNPDETALIKSKTGWVNTRDYGIMYGDGKLQVLGREEDIICRGHDKLFPGEFEDKLMEHQDISDAVIVGVPDEVLNEEICACVIEVPGSNLKSKISDLVDWCGKKFGAVRPKYFVFLDQLPLVENSKIDRYAIQNFAKKELNLI